jgi:hypothetical protein
MNSWRCVRGYAFAVDGAVDPASVDHNRITQRAIGESHCDDPRTQ